jgi:hypothetical protein
VKRRLGVIILLTCLLSGGTTAAQAVFGNTVSSQWGCVGSKTLNKIICVSDPLPERLPLPQ